MTEQLQAGGRIVVGTDLSHNADHAVDWAAERAVEVGAPLLVVLALPEVIIPRRVLPHHVLASDQGMDEVRQRASTLRVSDNARAYNTSGNEVRIFLDYPFSVF